MYNANHCNDYDYSDVLSDYASIEQKLSDFEHAKDYFQHMLPLLYGAQSPVSDQIHNCCEEIAAAMNIKFDFTK